MTSLLYFSEKKKNILLILFIIALFIHISIVIRYYFDKNDYINIDLLSFNKNNSLIFNGWTLSHLICYIIIGYYYPNEYYYIFIIGILWELYEFSYSYLDICKNIYRLLLKTDKMYIVGNIYDPLINLLGYFIGCYLSKNI
jgi:hypothetical protein